MRKISKIEPSVPALKARKKVAAYARVSMETERLMHSLSAQVSYYSGLIQKNPDWEYAGVYADDGISGTGTEKRTEFKRMIDDCEAGKIDIVLTKSISRFARNTVDLLETVRHLKNIGVEVWFEKENIRSMSGDGELMLTILASFAQEESRSISDNVKWGVRKRMQQGIPTGKSRVLGYRWDGDKLVIIPEEAEVVRRIYRNFIDGKSRLETERELEAEGIRSVNGCVMRDSNIKCILSNITYTGNLLLQKEFITDPITKHRKKNRGELPQYFVENTHEAIIDKETFDYVQEEMARRRELGCFANKSLDGMLTCFSTKIKCGQCGRSFVRSTRKNRAKISQLGERYTFWVCTSRKKTNCPSCSTGIIREAVLKEECAKVLGNGEFDEDEFAEKVAQITIPQTGTLIFKFKDGSEREHHWSRNAKKESWTPECRARASEYRRNHAVTRDDISCFTTKIKCAGCGNNFRRQTRRRSGGEKYHIYACATTNTCDNNCIHEDVLRRLSADALGIEKFDEAVFSERIDHITIAKGGNVMFHFKNGTESHASYSTKRRMPPWTEERKAKQGAAIRAAFTEERKKKMSETMKKIRSEKYWTSAPKEK